MRRTILLAAFAVLAVNASPLKEEEVTIEDLKRQYEDIISKERVFYSRNFVMQDGDGEARTIDLEAPIDYQLLEDVQRNPSNNAYWLYTRLNPNIPQILTINNVNSVLNSNFNANRQTVVVVHGWLSNGNTEPNPSVRNAYLVQLDVNIITLDWGRLAMSDYATAALGVPAVGRGLGQFLNWLVSRFGLSYNNIHLVGFSLGAHLVGNAGRETGGRVARITALDPAGPMWNINSNKIGSNDAVYVEAIHTDGGYTFGGLGIGSAVVQVDFFPNGGISQPSCWTNICNHNRAWELFASTVTYNHLVANRCSNNLQVTWNTCRGVSLHMGNTDLRKTGTNGSYRLDTARSYPF